MAQEELLVQLLGRVMRVGQLLAGVELLESEARLGENAKRKFQDEFIEGNEDPKKKQLKN
jgi:hypothetical protein